MAFQKTVAIPATDFDVIIKIANTHRNCFGLTVVAATEPKMLVKKLDEKFGRRPAITKLGEYVNYGLCAEYEKTVNRHRVEDGLDGNFVAHAPSGRHWDTYPVLLVSNTDPDKFYLRTNVKPAVSRTRSVFLIDGNLATPEETALIKECLPVRKPGPVCPGQGLSSDREVHDADFAFENIIGLFGWGYSWGQTYDTVVASL